MSMAMGDPMGSSSSNSQTISSTSFFTPLLISIMGIGATALAILLYHLLLVRYCIRRHAARMATLRTFAGGEEISAGVDEKTLLTIPIITYKKPDSNLVTSQSECAVCLGDLDDGDNVRVLPNCKHLFHVKCVDEWFVGHTSCPVCRVPVVAPCKPDNLGVVAMDDEIVRSCPVCRSVPTMGGDVTLAGSDDQTNGLSSGSEMMLRHCHSLVLPGERKERFTGMELKRSLSMGQSGCVIVDMNIDNVDKDCLYYLAFKDESVRHFQRMSLKVKQSISRMCVGQGQGQGSGILPY